MLSNNKDNNFYSRQIGTYGLNTQEKIMKMNIFIYGMRGVGIETAKNIVLAGFKSLTIFDPNSTKINDLTSNYFLKEEDVINCKRRDESSISYLFELNPNVNVSIMEGNDIIQDIIKKLKTPELKYDLVIITEFLPRKNIEDIDEICRKENIGFILSLEFGIYGFIFVDFGKNFTIFDEKGEETKEYLIEKITQEEKGKVFINTSLSGDIKLTSKDLVSFKEIEGMTELNQCSPKKIKINGNIIEIDDTSKFSEYKRGGILYNVKVPKVVNFDSFKERIEEPIKEGEEYYEPLDFLNPNIQEILMIGLLTLFDFYDKKGNLPEINNLEDEEEFIILGQNILKEKEKDEIYWIKNIRNNAEIYEVDFDKIFFQTLKYLSNWSKAEICPIASFLGGATSQEIIKFCGKYKPIHQWLYCDFSQLVENLKSDKDDRKMINSRYDDQIAIFGNQLQKKLSDANIFMIGAGALGCEFLKTFSAMGVSTNKNKNLYITDNDNIELSNLNRQFLFNKSSIGRPKAEVSCESIKKLNKDFNCIPYQKRVDQKSENFFDEEFWTMQDYIINAVDNIEARKYIARQCLIYKKILIDSGTLGTKANSQIMIPHKTIPYSPPEVQIEDKIPFCTLAEHPFNINHCIIWAKDNFNGYFVNILKDVKEFFTDREKFYTSFKLRTPFSDQYEKLKKIFEYSKIAIEKNFKKCVEKGLIQYNINFNNRILDLLETYGKNNKEFWIGDKRLPHPIPFDINNKCSFLFVKKYAQILARALGIPIINNDEEIIKIISCIKLEKYIPTPINTSSKSNNKNYNEMHMTKEEKKAKFKPIIEKVNNYIKEINKYFDSLETKINPDIIKIEEFDKDDESKGHVEFLYAFTNLRAENYNIEKCDIFKVKMTAGKIIPAIASTTAAIVGIVAMQLYILMETDEIKNLRNCYFDFARNIICFENLRKNKYIKDGNDNLGKNEKKIKLVPDKFSVWDYLTINGPLSIKNFIELIKKEYNIEVRTIISNEKILFKEDLSKFEDLNKKIEEVYNDISDIKLFENKKFLMLEILGDIDNCISKTPLFKYNFK